MLYVGKTCNRFLRADTYGRLGYAHVCIWICACIYMHYAYECVCTYVCVYIYNTSMQSTRGFVVCWQNMLACSETCCVWTTRHVNTLICMHIVNAYWHIIYMYIYRVYTYIQDVDSIYA